MNPTAAKAWVAAEAKKFLDFDQEFQLPKRDVELLGKDFIRRESTSMKLDLEWVNKIWSNSELSISGKAFVSFRVGSFLLKTHDLLSSFLFEPQCFLPFSLFFIFIFLHRIYCYAVKIIA